MKKILLLGANGQVGWELQRSLAPLGNLIACDRQKCDLANLVGLEQLILQEQPNIIVNASAFTAVDKAESEPEIARTINAEAVRVLADMANKLDAWLVHYSTDYVFDGTGSGPFNEEAPANPLNVYGQTKLEGEEHIRASGCQHLIFRTSWVYASRGSNFAKTMLRLAKEKTELKVVADQIGAPTCAELVADVTAFALARLRYDPELLQRASGTYHLTAGGDVSWHGFARFIIAEAILAGAVLMTHPDSVHPIKSAEYPLPARRPANSRLDTGKLHQTFGVMLPPWEFHARRMIKELIGKHQ